MKRNGSAVLSREAVIKIKELYSTLDEKGRRMHTLMSLGKDFGVSETTVLRAIKSYGAFMDVPEPMPPMTPEQERAHAERVLARAGMKLGDTKPPEHSLTEEYKDFNDKAIETFVGYGKLTREQADKILAERAAKS